jgi:hypothetical protein
VRVLRLGNSSDTVGNLPEASLRPAIAQRILSEASGQPVEMISRSIWPDPALPDIIAGWIERYQPDIVSLCVASFWVMYPSAPLRLQRHGGVLGKAGGSLGLKVAGFPALSDNRLLKIARTLALKTVGGAYYFEPQAMISLMDVCFRRVLRAEHVVLAVRGPAPLWAQGTRYESEARARCFELRDGVERLCEQLQVPFRRFEPELTAAYRRELQEGDGVHPGVAGHQVQGEIEGDLLVAAWQQADLRH